MNEIDVGALAGLELLAHETNIEEATGHKPHKFEDMQYEDMVEERDRAQKEDSSQTYIEPSRADVLGVMMHKHFYLLYSVARLKPEERQLLIDSTEEGEAGAQPEPEPEVEAEVDEDTKARADAQALQDEDDGLKVLSDEDLMTQGKAPDKAKYAEAFNQFITGNNPYGKLESVKEKLLDLQQARESEGEVDFEELMDWMNLPQGRALAAKAEQKGASR
jgi:hypothetical protein